MNLPGTSKASPSEIGFLGPMDRRKIGLFVSDPVPNAVGRLANLVLTANLCSQTQVQTMADPSPNPAGKTTIPHVLHRTLGSTVVLKRAAALVTLKVSDWWERLSRPADRCDSEPADVTSLGL